MSQLKGLVVARHRRHVTVEDDSGARQICQIQKRSLDPVVGDAVTWEPTTGGGVVTELQRRHTVLERIDKRGRPEAVAANLTQLLVVAAPEPAADWFVVDRYLAGAALANIDAVVVFNKVDVGAASEALDAYRHAGYATCVTSARSGAGIPELASHMSEQSNAFVGQSGVGKSSLINAILGVQAQSVSALSNKGGHGRHTTSTAMLYRLATGGLLIDSPGVRNFAPHITDPAQLEKGYREFAPYLGTCRFDNCRHVAEPGCAIKEAIETGAVSARRYESYVGLYELTRSFAASRLRGS